MNKPIYLTCASFLALSLLVIFPGEHQKTKQEDNPEQYNTPTNNSALTTPSKATPSDPNQIEPQSISEQINYQETIDSRTDSQQQSLNSPSQLLAEKLAPFNLSSFEDLPGFLKGTDINGILIEDSDGNLIKNKGLKRLIKHFQLLLAEGYTQTEVKDLLSVYFDEQVSEEAALQAKEFSQRYFQYQDQIKTLGEENNYSNNGLDYQLEVVLDIVEQRQELRRSYFTEEELETYFKDLEAYEAHQIEAHKILKNSNLDQEEKQFLVKELDSTLPLNIQQARIRTFATNHIATFQSDSIESSDRKTYLAEKYTNHFGEEAAERLLAQQQESLIWNEKRKHYLALKQSAEQKTELAADDRSEHFNAMVQQELNLTESEIMRMQALDRIDEAKEVDRNQSGNELEVEERNTTEAVTPQ